MHGICGYPIPEDDPKWSIKCSQCCDNCQEKRNTTTTNNNNGNESDDSLLDNVPLLTLAKKQKAAADPAPPKKKKKRPSWPDALYEDDPAADPSNWVFPTDKPEYLSPFMDFMGFIDNKTYGKTKKFTKEKLLTIKPKHVLAYLTHKAFGTIKRGPESKPEFARSNHIKNIKMKLSYFMPSGSGWVDLPNGTGHGNPTRHKSVNKLIADIIQCEVRGEGAEAHDVRDMTIPEFQKELELFRQHKDPVCCYRNPLMGAYQFNFITRADDVCNFRIDAPKGHALFDFALAQSVKWSKNVKDHRNCPDQLLLASMDYKTCMFIALSLWLEYFLNNHPEAEYMMTSGRPDDKSLKAHKKFTAAISKTYRNRLVQLVFKNKDFKSIYKGNDKRPLGLHSKRKMGSTQAKRRGAAGDQIDHRGRWVQKKGSRIVNGVYIDPEDVYSDAVCASKLALGGPIKYKLKEGMGPHITTAWLKTNVVPSMGQRYSQDEGLIRNLGLAMLWLVFDEAACTDLNVPEATKERVYSAYEDVAVENKPQQPVEKVQLHVYRHEDETMIEEIMPTQSTNELRHTGDALARVPADVGGGNGATQHVLQTVVIQQRNLLQQMNDLRVAVHQNDAATRVWMENKFRNINDNIRRFGGTMQGSLIRQDPN